MTTIILRRGAPIAALSVLLLVAGTSGIPTQPDPAVASAASHRSIGTPTWRFTPTATTNTLGVLRVVSRSVGVGGGRWYRRR